MWNHRLQGLASLPFSIDPVLPALRLARVSTPRMKCQEQRRGDRQVGMDRGEWSSVVSGPWPVLLLNDNCYVRVALK